MHFFSKAAMNASHIIFSTEKNIKIRKKQPGFDRPKTKKKNCIKKIESNQRRKSILHEEGHNDNEGNNVFITLINLN